MYSVQRRRKNPEEHRAEARRWRQRNPEKAREYWQKWWDADPEGRAQKCREGRERNREKKRAADRLYGKMHKEERRRYMRKYSRERRRKDPIFRLIRNLRNRVYCAVRRGFCSMHTMELLGCSKDELVAYVESQFEQGMTWDNYGEWHIDHIRPCSSFDLTLEKEQKLCFHWSNLRPLWASENLRKGSKMAV